MNAKGARTFILVLVAAQAIVPKSASAIFGEEDWLSGQNELLFEMLGVELEELTELTTLITNVRVLVTSANEALAIARTLKRAYEMIRTYDLEDLTRDAKKGLFRAMPELRRTEAEIDLLIENGRAIRRGEGAFFSKVTIHDAEVSAAARRSFEHGYQATIWPIVFPEAMKFHPEPSKVELLVQERYRRTADEARQAIQRTAIATLAKKVEAFVADAEAKDRVELRALTTNTEVNLQSMENSTALRNLEEQAAAEKEALRLDDQAFRRGVKKALTDHAENLVRPQGLRTGSGRLGTNR